MNTINCPHCGSSVKLDYNPGVSSEGNHCKCSHCAMMFLFDVKISITFRSSECECLNDGIHEWTFIKSRYVRDSHFVCKECGSTRSMTDEEQLKVIYEHARAGGAINHD